MKSADKIIKEEIANHLMEEQQNYMFFQNLKTICHAAEEMLKMNPAEVDRVLSDGHNWALDHIATSADDIEEVYHFLTDKNEGKITEASTEFEFNPTIYAGNNIKVKAGEDFLYGRVVGKNYTFTIAKLPNASLKIARWKEGKEPNNYTAFLSVPDNFSKLFSTISAQLKHGGKIINSTGTSSTQYSRYDLSKNELVKILKTFKTIKPTNEGKITEAVTKMVLLDLTGINGNETPYGSVYRGTAKVDGKDYKSYIEFDDTEWIGLPIESSVYKIVLSKLGIKVNDWKHNKQQFLRAFDTDYLYGKRWRLTYSNGKLEVDKLR